MIFSPGSIAIGDRPLGPGRPLFRLEQTFGIRFDDTIMGRRPTTTRSARRYWAARRVRPPATSQTALMESVTGGHVITTPNQSALGSMQ